MQLPPGRFTAHDDSRLGRFRRIAIGGLHHKLCNSADHDVHNDVPVYYIFQVRRRRDLEIEIMSPSESEASTIAVSGCNLEQSEQIMNKSQGPFKWLPSCLSPADH
jgi:hypothetical protein